MPDHHKSGARLRYNVGKQWLEPGNEENTKPLATEYEDSITMCSCEKRELQGNSGAGKQPENAAIRDAYSVRCGAPEEAVTQNAQRGGASRVTGGEMEAAKMGVATEEAGSISTC